MDKAFNIAVKFVLDWEGGYVNDPNDPGGETNYGISARAYPDLDIQNLTVDQAKAIYRRYYWDAINLDSVSYPLNFVAFNCCVNCGASVAKRLLSTSSDWKDFLFSQIEYYVQLKNANKYLKGWINRIIDLRRKIKAINMQKREGLPR